jgi:hypothetical protein
MLYCRRRGIGKCDGDSKTMKMLDMKTEINESDVYASTYPQSAQG